MHILEQGETTHSRSNTNLDDLIPLTGSFEDWVNLKIRLTDHVMEAYYNDELRYSMEYEGEIGQVKGIGFSAKGSGSVDWIRLSRINETIVYEEDFSDCMLNDDEECIEYSFGCEEIVGAIEIEESFPNVLIYPNPSSGSIIISLPDHSLESENISLVNLLGQSIPTEKHVIGNNLSIDLTGFPEGVYFIQLEIEGRKISRKVFVTG